MPNTFVNSFFSKRLKKAAGYVNMLVLEHILDAEVSQVGVVVAWFEWEVKWDRMLHGFRVI